MGGFISGERPWRRARRVIAVTAPSAGADWSATVPDGKLWELVSVYASLVTSATVANRAVSLTVSDGVAVFLSIPAQAVQAAGATDKYLWFDHASVYALSGSLVAAIPHLVLEPGWVLASSTALIDAGDQWGTPRLHVIETTAKRGSVDMDDVPEFTVAVLTAPTP